jgi:hypothetical protein
MRSHWYRVGSGSRGANCSRQPLSGHALRQSVSIQVRSSLFPAPASEHGAGPWWHHLALAPIWLNPQLRDSRFPRPLNFFLMRCHCSHAKTGCTTQRSSAFQEISQWAFLGQWPNPTSPIGGLAFPRASLGCLVPPRPALGVLSVEDYALATSRPVPDNGLLLC